MFENAYNLDVALDVVFSLRTMRCNERDNETDPVKKSQLQQEIEMLYYEREALYKGGEMQRSLIDKAFRLYAPILKSHYATV